MLRFYGFFLLCRNALRKTLYPRHWLVPGGHVEQSLEAARELLEKTGIKA
jgi:8-oxo-dGTP pyrophosphatase MutT (NUDIX family)